jgi:hypothetical protein
MVVEQIENPANRAMHYGDKPPVGTIKAPERLPKKVVYSNTEANRIYNQIQRDIYTDEKKAKPREYAKFPTILKILIGTSIIAGCILCKKEIGNFLDKYLKNPFKKTSH